MRLYLSVLIAASLSFLSNKLEAITIHCPQDYYLNCYDEIWDLSIYGNAYYIDNYIQYDAGSPDVNYHLNSCNTGYITRTWTVNIPYGVETSCTQTIHIQGGQFRYSDIRWPLNDLSLQGCQVDSEPNDLPYEYQRPRWNYVACSQVVSSFRDQEFYFSQDCKKIVRTWTVIDWCNYTGGSKGIFTYRQTIKISRDIPPTITCVKEISVQASQCDSAYVNVPQLTVEGASCTGTYTVLHDYPHATSANDASGMYPIGTTTIKFSVLYACGSEAVCQTKVKVNPPGPVPYCLGQLTVALMPQDTDTDGIIDDGMVEVWANDLNIGSYNLCNNNNLKFSFSSDVNDRVRSFTCADVGINTVQMWVTDDRGNQTFCLVNISVQNNNARIPNCGPDIGAREVIFGQSMDMNDEPLADVIITAKDRQSIYTYIQDIVETEEITILDSFYNQSGSLIYTYEVLLRSDTIVIDSVERRNVLNLYTDENGIFFTSDIPLNRDYEFTAYLADDISHIDMMDLNLLSNYLSGDSKFNNPYSYLAADINEDKLVDYLDYKILKDIINGEEDEWPKERQWVFYSYDDIEQMTDEPLNDNLSQKIEMTNLIGMGNEVEFMGVLKGDLSEYEKTLKTTTIDYRNKINNDVYVYPNPFTDRFFVSGSNSDDIKLELYNLDGKKIYEISQAANTEIVVKNNQVPNGTYMYRILIGNEEQATGKILKIE